MVIFESFKTKRIVFDCVSYAAKGTCCFVRVDLFTNKPIVQQGRENVSLVHVCTHARSPAHQLHRNATARAQDAGLDDASRVQHRNDMTRKTITVIIMIIIR